MKQWYALYVFLYSCGTQVVMPRDHSISLDANTGHAGLSSPGIIFKGISERYRINGATPLSSALPALYKGNPRVTVNSPHIGPIMRIAFPCHYIIMIREHFAISRTDHQHDMAVLHLCEYMYGRPQNMRTKFLRTILDEQGNSQGDGNILSLA